MSALPPPPPGDIDEGQRVWLRLRAVFGAPRPRREPPKPKGESMPFGRGRDPLSAATVLDGVTASLGWRTPLAQTDLTAAWRSIAGEETARHAEVEGFADGVLLVRCDSTAWATQLGLMRVQIAGRIAATSPTPVSRPSASWAPTPPAGITAADRFQGAARAIPTVDRGDSVNRRFPCPQTGESAPGGHAEAVDSWGRSEYGFDDG